MLYETVCRFLDTVAKTEENHQNTFQVVEAHMKKVPIAVYFSKLNFMENGKLILTIPDKSVGAVKRVRGKWDIFSGRTESSEVKWDTYIRAKRDVSEVKRDI